MKIQELFEKDVTRDIPPVVYFHEQEPRKLREEVEEYIITGGFPKGDPRAKRVERGIHEGFVNLLTAITKELEKPRGPELPASWISGFYGSGKSIFAKLLGMALDGATLDDGTPLADALLRRDDSPRRQEFVDAWNALMQRLDKKSIAVVFDIGAVARDNEHIHSAALRQIQARLGYCSKSDLVARFELKLERDGLWTEFLLAAKNTLGKPWEEAKEEELAEDHFSHVLHVMQPERYDAPTAWIETRAGQQVSGSAPMETIEAIEAMLGLRAKGRTLFFVVDEVSQYVHQDVNRMLKLQSFVSELGTRLKGAAWIFATGQQKLEDTGDTVNLSKLKDRFPEKLRVHLGATNIRDVVHKRLLKKRADKEPILRDLFQRHRSDLKLHGYSCEEITEEDFIDVYPMLPGHVDLLLQITTALRTRSTRVQGDDHAIRGLLQLLGELFRRQQLAERDVGDLVTLDAIYEVQQTALDPDVQTAVARITNHPAFRDDGLAGSAARAVALLELIQEQAPTTCELVASCLYTRVGLGNRSQAVGKALERLRAENLLGYSEKQGYKIQSPAGQEWERERRDVPVTPDKRSELVHQKLVELIGMPDRPRWKGNAFPWTAYFSDGRTIQDRCIQNARTGAAVTVDFRFLTNKEDRTTSAWVQRSGQEPLNDRLVWVVGDPGRIDELARDLAQSSHMVKRYEGRQAALPGEKRRLFMEEQGRRERLETSLQEAVAEAFFDGAVYFRGGSTKPSDFGGSFTTALTEVAKRRLPEIFPHFTDIAVTDIELFQLLEPQLSGPSNKFMEDGLGILALDAGRYVATCTGAVPSRILAYIEKGRGSSSKAVMAQFSQPPFGYPPDVIKACLAGLLRAAKISIRPEQGPEITSVRDPGTKDLFRKTKEGLGRAEIFPAGDDRPDDRDRIAMCKLIKDHFGVDRDRENDALADAVFQLFPARREALRQIEARLAGMPGSPEPPASLTKLAEAFEACMRTRQVRDIVQTFALKLDTLRDGLHQLALIQTDLSDEALQKVKAAAEVRDNHLAQLRKTSTAGEVEQDAQRLIAHLESERPWRDTTALSPAIDKISRHYIEIRKGLIEWQSQQADQARGRIKTRQGFEALNADQAHHVLMPIHEATTDTTEDALFPSLTELKENFPGKLAGALDEAHERLDKVLADITAKDVVKVEAGIRGRELTNGNQLDEMLKTLDERIRPLVKDGKRVVRIV